MLKRCSLNSIVFLSVLLAFSGCKQNPPAENNITIQADDATETINNAKKIFYSLPSPIETAMIIKTAGATYNLSLIHI